jgi:hypothetical protein
MRLAVAPIMLILLGIVLQLDNLNLLPAGEPERFFSRWWPLGLILIGVVQLKNSRRSNKYDPLSGGCQKFRQYPQKKG